MCGGGGRSPEPAHTHADCIFSPSGGLAAFEAPALVAGLDDVAVVGQPIEQRGGHFRIDDDKVVIGIGTAGLEAQLGNGFAAIEMRSDGVGTRRVEDALRLVWGDPTREQIEKGARREFNFGLVAFSPQDAGAQISPPCRRREHRLFVQLPVLIAFPARFREDRREPFERFTIDTYARATEAGDLPLDRLAETPQHLPSPIGRHDRDDVDAGIRLAPQEMLDDLAPVIDSVGIVRSIKLTQRGAADIGEDHAADALEMGVADLLRLSEVTGLATGEAYLRLSGYRLAKVVIDQGAPMPPIAEGWIPAPVVIPPVVLDSLIPTPAPARIEDGDDWLFAGRPA